MILFFVEQAIWTMSMLNSYRPTGFSQVSQYMKGIFYVPGFVNLIWPLLIISFGPA
jgi:hypothetical protein